MSRPKYFTLVKIININNLGQSGHVKGDITALRVTLEDGCQFKGTIDMQEQKSDRVHKEAGETTKSGGSEIPVNKR